MEHMGWVWQNPPWPRIHCRELTSHHYVFSGQNVFIWKLGALEVYSLWQWFNYHHCPHILEANPSFVEETISYCWPHISHKVSYCIPLYSMCFYWFYPILGVLNQKNSWTLHPNRSLPPKKKTSCRWTQVLDRFWVGWVHVPFPETFEAWSCLHHLESEDFPATFDDAQRLSLKLTWSISP